MTSNRANSIEVPVIEGSKGTIPVDEAKRIAASEIRIEVAKEEDAYRFVSSYCHTILKDLT